MSRVDIIVPDGLLTRVRAAGLTVSRIASAALLDELDRRSKVAELETYLRQLDAELGPRRDDERHTARVWADQLEAALPGGRLDARPA